MRTTAGRRHIEPFGDAALIVRFGDEIDVRINGAVHALAATVRRRRAGGDPWLPPVPGYASLLAPYDVLRWTHDEASAAMGELVSAPDGESELRRAPPIEIPVHYGGDAGPDLVEVAERCRMTTADVVDLHASVAYRAYLLGFAPGFAYLGPLPSALHLPRRDTPRQRVPAGSVAIAGAQTAVYPQSTPGGWHIIGRTQTVIWDAGREPPALIAAGDDVRFVAVGSG